jgi:NTE family protein
MNEDVKRIGLCLSGGGARGFAHLGVLQAIQEFNIILTQLSGSSAGAFAAVLFAEGHAPHRILEEIVEKSIWKYISFSPSKKGFFNLDKTAKILQQLIPHASFEGLKTPVTVCASNMSRGIPAYFRTGDLLEPVCASAAIPVAFRPININGFDYLDGGLTNNLPLEGLELCDFKIAVNVTPFKKELPARNMKDIVLKSLYISIDNQTKEKSGAADLNIVLEGIMKYDGFRFKHADKLFQLGYDAAIKQLQYLSSK